MEGRSLAVLACAAIALAAFASIPVATAEPDGHRVSHWNAAGEEGTRQDVVKLLDLGISGDKSQAVRGLLSDDDDKSDWTDDRRKLLGPYKIYKYKYKDTDDDDDDDKSDWTYDKSDWTDDRRKLLGPYKIYKDTDDDDDDDKSDWTDDRRKLLGAYTDTDDDDDDDKSDWTDDRRKLLGAHTDTATDKSFLHEGASIVERYEDDADKARKLLGRYGAVL